MTKKFYIQFFLIVIFFIISLGLFLKYFKKSTLGSGLITSFEKPLTNESSIEDLKYSSTDKEGNEYKIEAKRQY